MRTTTLAFGVALALAPMPVVAQSPAPVAAPAPAEAPAAPSWSGEIDANVYLHVEDGDFVMPVVRADRGSLHLEGRYQYEDRRSFSAWAGWTFEAGTTVRLEVVPMAGVIAGRTNGVAPGLEISLSWKTLELYSEGEYVFDVEGRENDYFYNWSQLTWQASEWLGLGLATQRTRLYQSEPSIDRGILAAVTSGPVTLSVYGFNLGDDSPFAIVTVGIEF